MINKSIDLSINETKILEELSKDSSQPNGRLAKKLKIHPTTVRRIKKKLEEQLGISYTLTFQSDKITTHKIYYIFQQLIPGARDNEELSRKMEEYYEKKEYITGYGKCIHGKWDIFVVFYCNEDRFDELFSEYKSRVNLMTEEMEIIKITQLSERTLIHTPIECILS